MANDIKVTGRRRHIEAPQRRSEARRILLTVLGSLVAAVWLAEAGGAEPSAGREQAASRPSEKLWDPITLITKNSKGMPAVLSALQRYTNGRDTYTVLVTKQGIGLPLLCAKPALRKGTELRFFYYEKGAVTSCKFCLNAGHQYPPLQEIRTSLERVFGKPASVLKNVFPTSGKDDILLKWEIAGFQLWTHMREWYLETPKIRVVDITVDLPRRKKPATVPVDGKTSPVTLSKQQRRMVEAVLGVSLEKAIGNVDPSKLLRAFPSGEAEFSTSEGLPILGIPQGISFSRGYTYTRTSLDRFVLHLSVERKQAGSLNFQVVAQKLIVLWGQPFSQDRSKIKDSLMGDYVRRVAKWRHPRGVATLRSHEKPEEPEGENPIQLVIERLRR